MDFSGIMEWGASVIRQNLGQEMDALPSDQLVSALQNLFGAQGGSLNLASLVSTMQEGGLGDIVNSWLGTGANTVISPDILTKIIDSGKIREFASQTGISEESARTAIANALPEIIDKASPAGNLLEHVAVNFGNLGGLTDIVGKFF
ncbi:MAG: DUF937 domain-containing protein [Chlorobiaceae bacterium]|nr:DUF937 domain-containing protein [Chlorobiaceae bacterium]